MTRCAITALVVLLCSAAALATPNLNQASGYVLVPDASIAPDGQWQYSLGYVVPRGKSELTKLTLSLPCDGTGFDLSALSGIGGRAEAGIGYHIVNKDAGDANAFTLALKTRITDDPDGGISAGFSFRSWKTDMKVDFDTVFGGSADLDLPNVTSLYVVMDRKWAVEGNAYTASFGLVYDSYSRTSQGINGSPLVVPFGPVDAQGTISSKHFIRLFLGAGITTGEWTFLADYKPAEKSGGFKYQDTFWSVAARRAVDETLTATAGFTTFNVPYTKSDPGFFLNLSYTK